MLECFFVCFTVFVRAVKCLAEPAPDDDDPNEAETEEEWKRRAEANPWLGKYFERLYMGHYIKQYVNRFWSK